MGEGEEHGIIKIGDFGLARIYQAPLKPLSDNGVSCYISMPVSKHSYLLCSNFKYYEENKGSYLGKGMYSSHSAKLLLVVSLLL
jgi:hypothetical protein